MYFTTFDFPQEIATYRGPPFDSEDCINFLKKWNINRRLSSAYYTQSSGMEEIGIKTAKRILSGSVDPHNALEHTTATVWNLLCHSTFWKTHRIPSTISGYQTAKDVAGNF